MIIDYATLGSLLSDTRASLLAGRLTTSLSSGGQALGYADNATLGRSVFAGQSVDATSLLVAYTYTGDANLDGTVNALDFNAVASNFGAVSGMVWTNGDFNYDGIVNTQDFTSMAANFGLVMSASPGPLATSGTLVPEPASLLMVIGAGLAIRRRRGVIQQRESCST